MIKLYAGITESTKREEKNIDKGPISYVGTNKIVETSGQCNLNKYFLFYSYNLNKTLAILLFFLFIIYRHKEVDYHKIIIIKINTF